MKLSRDVRAIETGAVQVADQAGEVRGGRWPAHIASLPRPGTFSMVADPCYSSRLCELAPHPLVGSLNHVGGSHRRFRLSCSEFR